jgi:two-component system sensor histidine kinase YesM
MRLLQKARAFSIRTKLIVLILLFLCLPFLVFGVLWYDKSSETIEQNAIHYSRQLVSQMNVQLESYFADLERTTFPLITHPKIQKFMKLTPEQKYELFLITKDIEKELIPNFIFGRADIHSFTIINQAGVTSSYGEVTPRERNLKYMREIPESKNYMIMGIGTINSTPVLTISRKFRDTLSYANNGVIIIDLNLNEIAKIAENVKLGKTGYVWILDSNANIVYHPDRKKWGQRVPLSYLTGFHKNKDGFFIKEVDGEKRLIIFQQSNSNHWITVSEVPMKELIGSLIDLRNVTIWTGLLLIMFVLIMLSGFSYYLMKSLFHLQKLMKRAESGDLTVQAPENIDDEIGTLNLSFNKMVGEIRRLIEVVHATKLKEKEMQIKQREAMMQAMQSQINPHFLYNTLEVINSYAIVEEVMPISKMATSLADMFRYSVGNPQQVVPLQEEVDHINTYFEIQKERYPYLQFHYDMDQALPGKVYAVRLMLQPIIENAIIHGYEKCKLRPEYIGLTSETGKYGCTLRIIDKGGGMDALQMKRFNRFFSEHPADDESELPFDRIGLWNVHHRIRLNFGAPYGLYVEKSDESGTVVQIKLPFLPVI